MPISMCIRRLLSNTPSRRPQRAPTPNFIRTIHHRLKSQIESDFDITSEPSLGRITRNSPSQSTVKKTSSNRTFPPWLAQTIYERRAKEKKSLFPELASSEFWTFKKQRTSSNKSVTMKYTARASTADWLISTLKGDVFGMDLEWNPFMRMDVSLVQICDEETVLLIHTAPMEGKFPAALKALLEDPNRIKCGVNIQNDASRLANVYGVYPAGLLELGRYANALDAMSWSRLGVRRSIISLENLAGMYLKQPLQKDQAVTDWGKSDLSYLQKLYAANDCYASWKICQVLDAMRKEGGAELPHLVDYRDVMKKKDKDEHNKRMRSLVFWGRKTVEHGRYCESLMVQIDEMVSVRISAETI